VLEQLAVNSDTVLQPLARDRARVAGAIRNSSDVARATAERREDLAADIQTLPEFLDELEPTMVRLGALADESTPLLRDLGARAEDINNVVERQGPFAQAAIPAFDSLGEAAKVGTPAITDARPVIGDIRTLARNVRPVGLDLREVLESFQNTQGIERLMDYIFYQVAAINGFDSLGHYLRTGLVTNTCTEYATVSTGVACTANFTQATAASADTTGRVSANLAPEPEPGSGGGSVAPTGTLLEDLLGEGSDPQVRREREASRRALRERASEGSPGLGEREAVLDYLLGGEE
jgi:hypothetical protein